MSGGVAHILGTRHVVEGRKTGRTSRILQEFSIPLIFGVVWAVVWANLDFHGYHAFVHWSPFGETSSLNFHFLVNDILMVFFFGIATKEITESCLPGGALSSPRKAVNPILGTLGGVIGPVIFYFSYVAATSDPAILRGWGIPTATDIALAWLVARIAFGKGHPAISFLLLLAIADDAIGLGIIAVFYPDPHHPVQAEFLLLPLAAIGLAFYMRVKKVRSFWAYLVGPGLLSWMGLLLAHLHPALALVPVVPFMPSMGYDVGLYKEEGDGHEHRDALNRFEHCFKKPVDFSLLAFGLANAGVVFSSAGNATWAVFLSLLVGKTVGIFLFSSVADLLGFKLPQGLNFWSLFLVGLTAGIGLTVALFVAGVAFTDPTLQGSAKMGALLSAAIAPVVIVLAKLIRPGNRDQVPSQPDSLLKTAAR